MKEGTRYDLLYDNMPWDSVDTVIFDIGNILIRFMPEEFLTKLFPGDEKKQQDILEQLRHPTKFVRRFPDGDVKEEATDA